MSRYQTIYEKLMSEQADNNFAFLDMEFLLSHISFQLKRIKGDHAIYASENFAEIINLQKVNGKVKPYQVGQVRDLIKKYKIGGANGEVQ